MRCLGFLFAAFVIALALLCSSCNTSTGSREPGPDARVSDWSVEFWDFPNATQKLWALETIREHDDLLRSHLHGEIIPRARLIVYETANALSIARAAAVSSYGAQVVLGINPLGQLVGFVDPWTRDVHYWIGSGRGKYEGELLTALMLHAVIGDPRRLDPRWQTFLSDSWFLQMAIAARR